MFFSVLAALKAINPTPAVIAVVVLLGTLAVRQLVKLGRKVLPEAKSTASPAPGAPAPTPTLVLRNVVGEVLLELPGRRDLIGADLHGCNLAYADLSDMQLFGANLEGACLMGARLFRTSFCKASLRNAEVFGATIQNVDFREADLRGACFYKAVIKSARWDGCLMDDQTDIPGRKIVGGTVRVIG